MPIDPIAAADAIEKAYVNYLTTTFKVQDEELREQLEVEIEKNNKFAKGPILEATPPFVIGKNLEQLIEEGVLCKGFKQLDSEVLPLNRPLYYHQEQAIRKVVQGRNIVVATGTGSGKTETFLIPIFDYLIRQKEEDKLEPGVRALLLYPMNALANDQIKRLRMMLKDYPFITFGRYTGETPETYKEALDRYNELNESDPLENELICREDMRNTPPHILLTNYAMLEYLLLRPKDNVFFDGQYAWDWRFIVLDEAHTYTGAKGMETAMLLRRLKERLHSEKFQCIATSATLGGGKGDFPQVAEFASKLFGESFEWNPADIMRQDVIEAQRIKISPVVHGWGRPKPNLYLDLSSIMQQGEPSLKQLMNIGQQNDIPDEVLSAAWEISSGSDMPAARFLYEVLRDDSHLLELQRLLEDKPAALDDLAAGVFDDPDKTAPLVALVDLAFKAKPSKEGAPLLPARYHMFVRAIEGAYISLYPKRQLYLERRESIEYDNKRYPVFEIATCRQCGAVYLVGTQDGESLKTLKQTSGYENSVEFYLISVDSKFDNERGLDEDDDVAYEGIASSRKGKFEQYTLCPACGCIEPMGKIGESCSCGVDKVELIRVGKDKEMVHTCPACGRFHPNGMVWRFLVGTEAASSVLATAFYQQLHPETACQKIKDEAAAALDENNDKDYHRTMLIFSDSRQDAAFFAPYLDGTYRRILHRRIITEAVTDNIDNIMRQRWRLQDLVEPVRSIAVQCGMFSAKQSMAEQRGEVLRWLMYEFARIDPSLGLETMGLLSFVPIKPVGWRPPEYLLCSPWNFTEEEVWTLFCLLLDQFRINGAVTFPENVPPEDEFFAPKNREYYFRKNVSSSTKHIYSWMPAQSSRGNSRLDLLMRMAHRCGIDVSSEKCLELLSLIWDKGWGLGGNGHNIWSDYFCSTMLSKEGRVYRLDYRMWELEAKTEGWYYCDKCHNLTRLNIRGTCPVYRCDGHLQPCNPETYYATNHYRQLYKQLLPQPLRVKEHTAQLSSEAAGKLQAQFINGSVNALSCSTTFELGVDVGDLEMVFLRNVPPSPANYIQRAGRAGRRTSSTAFVLTYAQRRPHDLAYFRDPIAMVAGKISAPHFDLVNEKIIRRHVHSVVLADFWRQHEETFGDVERFFFSSKEATALVAEHLQNRPQHILESLKRIVPQNMHDVLGLDDWSWVKNLLDQDDGVLYKAELEVIDDVEALESMYNKKTSLLQYADNILRAINTIKGRELIGYLANRNVLPKYGFPVDVIALELPKYNDPDIPELELQRDLRLAISEYAPDSQVVAGGRLWTGRYLKRITKKTWPEYEYAVCECGNYQRVLVNTGKELEKCDKCGRSFNKNENIREKGIFVIPEFGFIADSVVKKPGISKPERTYSTRPYYTGEADERLKIQLNSKGISIEATPASHGKIAVLNTGGKAKFYICKRCGYARLASKNVVYVSHKDPHGNDCSGIMSKMALGYEFETDILRIQFGTYRNDAEGFWHSLLYAILEGAADALNIERQDIDGCLYSVSGDKFSPALILFDDVPGGAGHVSRIADEETLKDVLKAALDRMSQCKCGGEEGEASCYGCLRNYKNQRWHDILNRGMAIRFLKRVC